MHQEPSAAALDGLLAAYLRSLDAADDVPAFSLWRYAALFGQLLRWELAFLALLFVTPVLDLIRYCLRRCGVEVPRSPSKAVWRDIKRPFAAIWRGDITALQVVRVRLLARAFIGSHVAGVVDQLKLRTERARLDALLAGSAEELAALDTERQKLEGLAGVAKAQNSLGAVVATGSASAVPLALAKLLIPAVVKLLPGDVADQIGAVVPLGPLLKAIGLAEDEGVALTPMLLAVGGGFLTFLLITAMSCHIEKQRILSAAGAYAREQAVLQPRRIGTFEIPLDVVFAAGAATAAFLTVYFYASLAIAEPDRSDQMQTAIADLVLCLVVAAIVAARRWVLGRPPGALPIDRLWSLAKLGMLRSIGRAP